MVQETTTSEAFINAFDRLSGGPSMAVVWEKRSLWLTALLVLLAVTWMSVSSILPEVTIPVDDLVYEVTQGKLSKRVESIIFVQDSDTVLVKCEGEMRLFEGHAAPPDIHRREWVPDRMKSMITDGRGEPDPFNTYTIGWLLLLGTALVVVWRGLGSCWWASKTVVLGCGRRHDDD